MAFECIPSLKREFRENVEAGEDCPRMCKTKFKSNGMKGLSLQEINDSLGDPEDIQSIMEADDGDALLLNKITDGTPGDESFDMIQDAWNHRLEVDEKKIFWKDLYDLDVKGRSVSLPSKKDVGRVKNEMKAFEDRLLKMVNEKFEEKDKKIKELQKQVKKLKERVKLLEDVKRSDKEEEEEEEEEEEVNEVVVENEQEEEEEVNEVVVENEEEKEEEVNEVDVEKKKQEGPKTPRPQRRRLATFAKGPEYTSEGKKMRKRKRVTNVEKVKDAKKPNKMEKKATTQMPRRKIK